MPTHPWLRLLPFAAILLVVCAGMPLDVMEVDAAQYAAMSREMLQSGNWLQLVDRGESYLDKPPLLFWLSALSYALLGVSNFAYKLPSVLAACWAVWAIYKWAQVHYSAEVAYIAALLFASMQSFYTMTFDVRTDTLLTAGVATALWQLSLAWAGGGWRSWLGTGVGIAWAMLAKGPIGLIVPLMGLFVHLLVTVAAQRWQAVPLAMLRALLQRWQLFITCLVVVALLLLPMCIGLYQQYGAQGLEFYFWTQSFGRITGSNEWNNDGGLSFFFAHTFLWTFLPWSLITLPALWFAMRNLWRDRAALVEGYSLGAFILPILALSFSRYKLPHYIFVALPAAALLTAVYVQQLQQQASSRLTGAAGQGAAVAVSLLHRTTSRLARIYAVLYPIICGLLAVALVLLCTWAFRLTAWWQWVLLPVGLGFMVWYYMRHKAWLQRVLWLPIITVCVVNLMLYLHLYPSLLTYQSTGVAARLYQQKSQPDERLYGFQIQYHSLDFYTGKKVHNLPQLAWVPLHYRSRPIWLYTHQAGYDSLQAYKANITEVHPLPHYHITKLTPLFVNPTTRAATLERRYLLRMQP